MPSVIIIVGPTASGKSDVAVDLALQVGGEIISADSRQVYRGLDIGTGKITVAEMRGIPHYMLDIASLERVFTAYDYTIQARQILDDIISRGKVPIIVGGTGFYIDALVGRISPAPIEPNLSLRTELAALSSQELCILLSKYDPARALSMSTPSERNNRVRLIRAIEVASALHTENPQYTLTSFPYPQHWYGIAIDTHTMRKRIIRRLDLRLADGMIQEVEQLHIRGLSYARMEELGLEYRFVARYLEKLITYDEMRAQLASAIYQYAKRQKTYWKRNHDIMWYDRESIVESILLRWNNDA